MRTFSTIFSLLAASLLATATASAGEYKCNSDRVEKGGSTQYTVKRSGSDITIEKGGSTKGKAVKRNDKYAVEVGGSTQGWIEGDKILKGNTSSWASVSEAKQVYDCEDVVAATLWILSKSGKL